MEAVPASKVPILKYTSSESIVHTPIPNPIFSLGPYPPWAYPFKVGPGPHPFKVGTVLMYFTFITGSGP